MSKTLSPQEVASHLGCRVRTIYILIKRKEIKAFRLRRQIRVLEADLQEFIEIQKRREL